ncbi:hypothetical protein XBO1_1240029 [Xenorhabdus bovienii str. oregonense]|uniref:Uncharacterized protein n=1 Tax=Xenorhabdus bovienii str. oregonense TaxID=1398202 RepID=A0A077P0T8_XENBV|nr:hypothetical protein XBO1_1240029 [Xenorhabdus bovienii str. oregonense]
MRKDIQDKMTFDLWNVDRNESSFGKLFLLTHSTRNHFDRVYLWVVVRNRFLT